MASKLTFTLDKVTIKKLIKFKVISEICTINEQTIEKELNSNFTHFEDSFQYFSAVKSECEIISTKNGKDFKNSLILVMNPAQFLKSL